MTVAQKFAATFGGVYVLVGILGFVVQVGGTTNQDGNHLLGIFGITAVHNLVHLLIGFIWLAASSNPINARTTSLAIGVVYVLVGVIGLFNIDFINDLLFLNAADHVLHFGTGFLALAVGSGKLDAAMA